MNIGITITSHRFLGGAMPYCGDTDLPSLRGLNAVVCEVGSFLGPAGAHAKIPDLSAGERTHYLED